MIRKFIFTVLFFLPVALFAQDLKFGYVDMNQLFTSMPETEVASSRLDTLTKRYEGELLSMQEEYRKKSTEFVAQRDTILESIRVRRMAEIQDLQERMQEFYQFSERDLQTQRTQLLTPINEKLQRAVKAVGEENGFVYIFDTSANAGMVYWSMDKCTDVTNLVRSKLNLK
ncbi:MAG: OmpH family outer membrane protein [Bacteroidales bacterium]|jgi:outer membrane protein|nr:OmpH family outer membrane protein [Bacteroidales bacterium]MDD4770553.1 OmpH family outer membrane protein [Bacteroidales bacterium]